MKDSQINSPYTPCPAGANTWLGGRVMYWGLFDGLKYNELKYNELKSSTDKNFFKGVFS